MMLSKSDEEIPDDRLKNWGRWIADRRYPKTNMLHRMMVAAGEIKLSPYKPAKIDHADAILVDRAWRMMPQNPIRYWVAKNTLIAQYAYPQLSVRSFCDWVKRESRIQFHMERPLRINQKDYEILLKTARYEIFNLLDYQASKKLACIPDKNQYD